MTSYVFYTAGANERWDTVAYKALKNTYQISKIIEANPQIPISTEIKEGTELIIPIEENPPEEINQDLLPIWKRN